jgi:hypothetical protein
VKDFEKAHRRTKKEKFLSGMERLVPWGEFCALIEPYTAEGGEWTTAGGAGADAAEVLSGERV